MNAITAEMLTMTQRKRNRWSAFAVGASIVCSILLMISAIAAASAHQKYLAEIEHAQPQAVSRP